jgi:carbamoyl-phosphate synthase large subunit
MVNSNPETVSTDYDTSDKLYFEPLTREDVLPYRGEGKTRRGDRPVRRADPAEPGHATGRMPGSHPGNPSRQHRPGRRPGAMFQAMLNKLNLMQPANGTPWTLSTRAGSPSTIGYPVIVRPSFVLGGGP